MQIEVNLGGCNAFWHFHGSATFQSWLERRPWMRDGGICVIRSRASNTAAGPLIPAIRRGAHAVHEDNGYLTVRVVSCGGAAGTPQQALMRHFGLDINMRPVEARDLIRTRLLDRRQLLIMQDEDEVDLYDWERFFALTEHYLKAAVPVPLAIVVIDTRAKLTYEPVCHFDTGYTRPQVLADAAIVDDPTIWSRYVHMRAWWDAAGSMDQASALTSRLATAGVGRDEAVEDALQTFAEELWPTYKQFENLLHQWLDSGRRPAPAHVEAELLNRGLLWRPPGMQGLQVVPSVGRSVLKQPSLPEIGVWHLRPAIVCAPLAAELLSLCLLFENRIRLRLSGRGDIGKLKDETKSRHQTFCDGNDLQTHYPVRHPAPPLKPSDVWAFASLGETLYSCSPSLVSDVDKSVRDLRNGLAHGHYVGWWHCEQAKKVLRTWNL